ncbi:MAG: hypothetical protein LBV17_06200 [Treponema sp.]|jgi:hypothetical protein|nr:hypothetical protein [Treponema sp.]
MRKIIIYSTIFLLLSFEVLFANENEVKSKFKNSHAVTATIMDVQEASFMESARRLKEGDYYIIYPCVNQYVPSGNIIALRSLDYETWINAYIYELYRWLKPDMPVYVLVRYSNKQYYKFHVVEMLQQ